MTENIKKLKSKPVGFIVIREDNRWNAHILHWYQDILNGQEEDLR